MNVNELIEKLKEMPQDAKVIFYEQQYEKASWSITDISLENNTVIMIDDDWGV